MRPDFSFQPRPAPLAAALLLLAASLTPSHAQFPGFGGGGGGGGATRRSGSGTSAREYPNNTQVGDATISYDPETRKIIVVTDDETNLQIKDVIQNLDNPRPQVLIKVVFLEVTHNDSLDLGVEGAYRNSGSNLTNTVGQVFGLSGLANSPSNTAVNGFGLPTQGFSPIPPGAGVYQVMGSEYQVTLRAIAQAGKAEILSRPSILARNNQPATISLGQQVPLVTNTRFDAINGQINTVSYQSVGIILRVTPFITPDGMVEMIVSPETSQLADRSQWVPISRDALAPVINSRVADTVVVVPDGQTVIIGGLIANQQSNSDSKIPWLGDIPGLGFLFKRKQKAGTKTELMIFLTPTIIAAPSQLAGLTAEERSKAMLKPKALSEKQLEDILGTIPARPPGSELEPAPSNNRKAKGKK